MNPSLLPPLLAKEDKEIGKNLRKFVVVLFDDDRWQGWWVLGVVARTTGWEDYRACAAVTSVSRVARCVGGPAAALIRAGVGDLKNRSLI